jgi:hypothetical protein
MSIEDRYRHDGVFNRVVDQLRALLRMYQITPSELREAVILAATMHESELNQQLYYARVDEFGKGMRVPLPAEYNWEYRYAYDWAKPPLMFGGIDPIGCVAPKKPVECDCTKELGSAPKHCHIFRSSGYGYDVCNDCGISDVYYNWEYNKKS